MCLALEAVERSASRRTLGIYKHPALVWAGERCLVCVKQNLFYFTFLLFSAEGLRMVSSGLLGLGLGESQELKKDWMKGSRFCPFWKTDVSFTGFNSRVEQVTALILILIVLWLKGSLHPHPYSSLHTLLYTTHHPVTLCYENNCFNQEQADFPLCNHSVVFGLKWHPVCSECSSAAERTQLCDVGITCLLV